MPSPSPKVLVQSGTTPIHPTKCIGLSDKHAKIAASSSVLSTSNCGVSVIKG